MSPVTLVTSSKKSGLARPFTRLSPIDLVLYQALVDRLAGAIESALPSRDLVFAYRQTLEPSDDPYEGTPGRAAYARRMQTIVEFGFSDNYAITADIAGYYMHIDIEELERTLLTVSLDHEVVRDLGDLLRAWRLLGVRGLPQGVRPSSPLSNLYLRPLDSLLAELGVRYVRWIDDIVIATETFHHAREVLDAIEGRLYEMGLTLAAEKTKIRRYDVTYHENEDASARLQRLKQASRNERAEWLENAANWMDYPPDEATLPDPKDLDRAVVVARYKQLLEQTAADDLPKGFQPDVVAALRELTALEEPCEMERLPDLLTRAPDVTRDALRYLATAAKFELLPAVGVFTALLSGDRFMRDLEKLDLSAAVLTIPERRAITLASPLRRLALHDGHPLVRARALLAWGAQSEIGDFQAADRFWVDAGTQWRPYALVAIQGKERRGRDGRYDRWSGEGRFLGRLAATLKTNPIAFRKL